MDKIITTSLNKGKFLGEELEWKSNSFKILENFGLKKLYFLY